MYEPSIRIHVHVWKKQGSVCRGGRVVMFSCSVPMLPFNTVYMTVHAYTCAFTQESSRFLTAYIGNQEPEGTNLLAGGCSYPCQF